MSERALRRVGGTLAAFLILWIVLRLGGRGEAALPSVDRHALSAILGGATGDSLVAVHFEQGDAEPVRLARDGDRWAVNGLPADSAAVARLWSELDSARVREMVASSPTNHARLGVAAGGATVVVFERVGAADTLLVGKAGPERESFYARLPGGDEVYRVDADLRAAAQRDVTGWRDKRIVALDTSRVTSLSVTRAGVTHTLIRAEEAWTVDGAAADEGTLRDLLAELSSFVASGFSDEEAEGEPDRVVTARDAGGQVLASLELWDDETSPLVRRGEDATLYTVSAWRADRLAPAPDALREREGSKAGGSGR